MTGVRRVVSLARERARGLQGALLADVAWGSLFEVVLLFSSLATFVILSRALGRDGFGLYAAIQGLVVVLATFASAWVGAVMLQQIRREHEDAQVVVRSLAAWYVVGSVTTLAAGYAIQQTLLPQLPTGATLAYVAAEVIGNSTVSFGVSIVQALDSFAASARPRVILETAQALLLVGLLVAHDVTLLSTGVGLLVVNLTVGVVALDGAGVRCGVSLRPGLPRIRHARRGALYAAVLTCFAVEEDADKTLLVRYRTGAVAGVYAASYRIVQIGLVPLRAMVSSMHNRFLVHDPDAIGEHLRRSWRFTLPSIAYGIATTGALWIGAPLVSALLGGQYRQATEMIRALSVLVLLRSSTVFAFNGLMGLGKVGYRTVVLAMAAAVNVTINVTLIPVWSWRAAALATAAGEVVFLVGTWSGLVIFQRRHDAGVRARRSGDAGVRPSVGLVEPAR